jgi:hypothetical protein
LYLLAAVIVLDKMWKKPPPEHPGWQGEYPLHDNYHLKT